LDVLTLCRYNYPLVSSAAARPLPIERALKTDLVGALAVRLHYCYISTRYGCQERLFRRFFFVCEFWVF